MTAIEYIRSQIMENGKECLRGLLNELTAENMSDINNLYRTIWLAHSNTVEVSGRGPIRGHFSDFGV